MNSQDMDTSQQTTSTLTTSQGSQKKRGYRTYDSEEEKEEKEEDENRNKNVKNKSNNLVPARPEYDNTGSHQPSVNIKMRTRFATSPLSTR